MIQYIIFSVSTRTLRINIYTHVWPTFRISILRFKKFRILKVYQFLHHHSTCTLSWKGLEEPSVSTIKKSLTPLQINVNISRFSQYNVWYPISQDTCIHLAATATEWRPKLFSNIAKQQTQRILSKYFFLSTTEYSGVILSSWLFAFAILLLSNSSSDCGEGDGSLLDVYSLSGSRLGASSTAYRCSLELRHIHDFVVRIFIDTRSIFVIAVSPCLVTNRRIRFIKASWV